MRKIKTPTDKQIAYVNSMAAVLELDFPQSSKDFTLETYSNFISEHVDEFNLALLNDDPDYLYLICENDIWGEFY